MSNHKPRRLNPVKRDDKTRKVNEQKQSDPDHDRRYQGEKSSWGEWPPPHDDHPIAD